MIASTIVEAINLALKDAMKEDEKVLVFGEDVGRLGGVFRVTAGLNAEFGDARCFDTPLAESGIVGFALGLAMRGYRPVPEIQFAGFTYPALDSRQGLPPRGDPHPVVRRHRLPGASL